MMELENLISILKDFVVSAAESSANEKTAFTRVEEPYRHEINNEMSTATALCRPLSGTCSGIKCIDKQQAYTNEINDAVESNSCYGCVAAPAQQVETTDSQHHQDIKQAAEVYELCLLLASKMAKKYKTLLQTKKAELSVPFLPRLSSSIRDEEIRSKSTEVQHPPAASTVYRGDVVFRLTTGCCPCAESSQLQCESLKTRISSLEAQLALLVDSGPFDCVAILDEKARVERLSANYQVALAKAVSIESNKTKTSERDCSQLVLLPVRPEEKKEGSCSDDDTLAEATAILTSSSHDLERTMETKCVAWSNRYATESGCILFGKKTNSLLSSPTSSITTLSACSSTAESDSKLESPSAKADKESKPNYVQGKSINEKKDFLSSSFSTRELLDLIPHIVFIADARGDFVYCNEAWFQNYHVARGNEDEFNWKKVIHPEDAAKCFDKWEKAVREGTPYLSEDRCLDPATGKALSVLCRALPVKNSEGNVSFWFGTCTDVSELREAQRELVLMQQKADAVVKNCCAILWAVDTNGIFTFFSGRGVDLLGIDPADRVGKSYYDIYGARPGSKDALQRALAGQTANLDLVALNNSQILLQTTFSPLYDERRESVIGVVGVTVDVTERKARALEFLKWEKTFTHSRSGISISGPDGTILNVNPAFAEMYGGTVESFIDVNLRTFFWGPSDPIQGHAEQFKRTGHVTYESIHRRRDGSTFPVLTDTSGVKDGDGQILFAVTSYIDLTESKRAEEEKQQLIIKEQSAIQASALKTQFLAMMSHEIRTPLNGIIGMIDLACDGNLGSEERLYLQTARQSATSLSTIINDILDLSKIEAGKLKLEHIDFDLLAIIREVVLMLSFAAREKGIFLEHKTPPTAQHCYVKGDPVRLRQILTNLISNAIKFTNSGGIVVSIEVSSLTSPASSSSETVREKRLTISVQDTGLGISADVIPTLFQPFSQADISTTRKYGGTGLGLSISKQLINLMNGDIWVESTLGVGSRFWFTMDCEEGQAITEEEATKQAQPLCSSPYAKRVGGVDIRGNKEALMREVCKSVKELGSHTNLAHKGKAPRILVVDDNNVNLLVTSKLLQKLGYDTHCATNGKEALDILHKERFDVVLMDCHMPDMDGYEATRLLRQSTCPEVKQIPVIALTANALVGEKDKCIDCGMNDHLSKPVSRESLSKAVSKWVGGRST